MQIADEFEMLKAYEKKWSEEVIDEVNKLIKELDERDAILAPYIREIEKHFGKCKIEIRRKE